MRAGKIFLLSGSPGTGKTTPEEGLRYRSSGGKANKSVIATILTSSIYCGEFIWKGEVYKGSYQPIISKELFTQVQDVIQGKGSRPSKPLTHFFAFQGMITCARCGCAMVAELKKRKYIYYHCTQNRGKCSGKCVREEVLDLQFMKSIEAIALDSEVVGIMRETAGDETRLHDNRIAVLSEQRKKLEARIKKSYMHLSEGIISVEEYQSFTQEFKRELTEIDATIERHQSPNPHYLDDAIRILELAQNAARLYSMQNMQERRKLVKLVHSNSSWEEGVTRQMLG